MYYITLKNSINFLTLKNNTTMFILVLIILWCNFFSSSDFCLLFAWILVQLQNMYHTKVPYIYWNFPHHIIKKLLKTRKNKNQRLSWLTISSSQNLYVNKVLFLKISEIFSWKYCFSEIFDWLFFEGFLIVTENKKQRGRNEI